jgi:hypothetical protein
MHDDLLIIEKEAQYRRQAAEHYARQWRMARLDRPRSRPALQARARLVGLADSVVRRVNRWRVRPSKPQEQCC